MDSVDVHMLPSFLLGDKLGMKIRSACTAGLRAVFCSFRLGYKNNTRHFPSSSTDPGKDLRISLVCCV